MEEIVYDESVDYTRKGEIFERENYKAFITNLPQEVIVKMLLDNMKGSKLVLTNWEKKQLAENLAEIKFGKEEE